MRYSVAMLPLAAGLFLGGGHLSGAGGADSGDGNDLSALEDPAPGGDEPEAASAPPKDPAAHWVGAYAWVQTGRDLSEARQWPLAQACFLEARRQMAEVAEFHPGFEPDLVRYRIKALGEEIAGLEDHLGNGDHEVMMKFLDFIESFERGEALRYADEFQTAYETLDFARGLLDDVEASRPDSEEVREALVPQRDRIEGHLEWLANTLHRKRTPSRAFSDTAEMEGVDWGTTEFVGSEDLPRREEEMRSSRADEVLSPDLFPGDLFPGGNPRDRRRSQTTAAIGAVVPRDPGSSPEAGNGEEKALPEKVPEGDASGKMAGDLPRQFRFRLSTREGR